MLLKRCDRCGRVRALDSMNESVIKIFQGTTPFTTSKNPDLREPKTQYRADLCDYCYEDLIRGYKKFMEQ